MSPVRVTGTLRLIGVAAVVLLAGCRQAVPPAQSPESYQAPATASGSASASEATPPAPPPVPPVREGPTEGAQTERAAAPAPRRDLSKDEARGGHTIARHVGRTDQQLRDRLRAEPSLTVVSTYTDLTTAETTVEAAFRRSAGAIRNWSGGRGQRQNLAIDYVAPSPVGRSLRRGGRAPSPCAQAVVVLRWDERRNDSYVLTSYPDCRP
jgi:hypothetical protein